MCFHLEPYTVLQCLPFNRPPSGSMIVFFITAQWSLKKQPQKRQSQWISNPELKSSHKNNVFTWKIPPPLPILPPTPMKIIFYRIAWICKIIRIQMSTNTSQSNLTNSNFYNLKTSEIWILLPAPSESLYGSIKKKCISVPSLIQSFFLLVLKNPKIVLKNQEKS